MVYAWFASAVVFCVIEAVTVSLVSLWFVGGALIAILAAMLSAPVWLQILLFFVASLVSLAVVRPVAKRIRALAEPTNFDMVYRQSGRVTETIDNDQDVGEVYINGKTWRARSTKWQIIESGTIVSVDRVAGVTLYVSEHQN